MPYDGRKNHKTPHRKWVASKMPNFVKCLILNTYSKMPKTVKCLNVVKCLIWNGAKIPGIQNSYSRMPKIPIVECLKYL